MQGAATQCVVEFGCHLGLCWCILFPNKKTARGLPEKSRLPNQLRFGGFSSPPGPVAVLLLALAALGTSERRAALMLARWTWDWRRG